jgi:26S proteasome non-ATPase regulatory subunit 9
MESSNRPPAALAPFAVVNSVAEGSPAGDAGLRKGDRILRFGSVNAELPDCMQAVARLVGRYEDVRSTSPQLVSSAHTLQVRIPLVILRADSDEQMLLPLTPRTWRGRGLLGCVPSLRGWVSAHALAAATSYRSADFPSLDTSHTRFDAIRPS